MLPYLPSDSVRSGRKIRLILHCLYAGWSPIIATAKGISIPGLYSDIRDNLLVLEKNGCLLKFEKQGIVLLKKAKSRALGHLDEYYSAIGGLTYNAWFCYDEQNPFKILRRKTKELILDLKKPEQGFHLVI